MALGRCWLPKESSQFDETIENHVIWRMAIFMLIDLSENKFSSLTFEACM